MEDGTVAHVNPLPLPPSGGGRSRCAEPRCGALARRGFEESGISRLTMVVAGDDQVIEQMTKQLLKLVNVLKVQNLSHIPRWSGN